MSARANEYRGLIEDVVAGGLLDEDEWMQLGEVLARITRKLEAQRAEQQSVDQPCREAVE